MSTLENIREWFFYADNDYDTVEILLGHYPLQLEIICFHCQQAVEKWLKAYLIYNGLDELSKTHNLVELCDECSVYDENFGQFRQQFETLTKHAVIVRYPRESRITELNMRKAYAFTAAIREFAPLAEMRAEAFAETTA
ncbi:MAG: HEPN domain-containing protein [Oscillospiraceae bacterium]|jgi:HEPN domain-containing protein|nr:HEPN domain-containing protein [Oscillospiraceae bacterium]